MLKEIQKKIEQNIRISRPEAEWLYLNASNAELSTLATMTKTRFHNPKEATYLVMAIVNYTNICVAKCDYCSFYRLPHQEGTYLLSTQDVFKKIDELVSFGGTLVGFNGGFHPKLTISHYAELFKAVHEKYPNLAFYEMTVAEFMFSCKVTKISYTEGAKILKDAGTKWVTGGGSEILDDNFRFRHSPGKYTVADFYDAQKAILDAGMGSTATMVIGFDETLDERLNHLEKLRLFQDQNQNRLTSFLCWTYKPFHNEFGGKEISSEEYLRWLAISRIYLDNIKHIRSSVLTKNKNAIEGLLYGANDFDIPTEDEVTQKAGATISHDFEELLQEVKKLGITPIARKAFPSHAEL